MTTTATQLRFPEPNEIEGYWDWDKIHAPRPLTPLAGDAIVMSMAEGFTDRPARLRLDRWPCAAAWSTTTSTPAFVLTRRSPPPTTGRRASTCRSLERIAAGIGERWINEWEPSLMPILHRARTADYPSMSDDAAAAELEQQLKNQVYYVDDPRLDQPDAWSRPRR